MDLKKRDDIKKLNIEFPFGTVFESFQDILPSNSKEYVLTYNKVLKHFVPFLKAFQSNRQHFSKDSSTDWIIQMPKRYGNYIRHHYYAAVTYIDNLIGKVISYKSCVSCFY